MSDKRQKNQLQLALAFGGEGRSEAPKARRGGTDHGRASRQAIPRRGFVVVDSGVILRGYCSDMTRTVHMGRVAGKSAGGTKRCWKPS